MTAYVRKILTVSKILYRFDGGPIDFEALDFSLSNPLVNPALVVTMSSFTCETLALFPTTL